MRSISRIGIALAIASACSYVGAATTTPTATRLARESTDTNILDVNAGGLGGASALRFTTAALGTGQRLTLAPVGSAAFAAASKFTPTFTCSSGSATAVFEIATGASSSSGVVYDISVAGGGSLNGASCGIPSIVFTAASMRITGNVQITGAVTSVNTGSTIDSFTATTVASVGNTFTVGTTPFNGVIDVTKGRLTFSGGAETSAVGTLVANNVDSLTVTVTPDATRLEVPGSPINTLSLNLTLTASNGFQFLQEPSTTAGASLNCSADTGSGQATATVSAGNVRTGIVLDSVSGDCKTMTASFTGLSDSVAVSQYISLGRISVDTAPSVATAYGSNVYTVAYSMNRAANTLTASNSASTLDGGSWTQNGASSLRLNYVPVSDNTTLQILISNDSNVAGTVDFVAYSGGATCTGNLGAVAARGTTAIGGALRSALRGTPNSTSITNCTTTFDDATNSAVVLLTTTTPSASTKIHSGFTVTGDTNPRQILINSTN